MSPPDNSDQARSMVVHKPKSDVFTALLGISALALLVGCLFLLLEWATYADSFSPFELYGAVGGPK